MKILITGSSGFIGQNLIPLFDSSYTIRTWDKRNGKDIFSKKLEKEIKECDIVYHLAAQVSVEKSFKNPFEVFYTNVLGTARIVQLCVEYGKKLIYPSTVAVYHKDYSPYSLSKAVAEDIVWGVRGLIPVVILRLYNVYGKGMNPKSGSIMYCFLKDKKIVLYGDGEQTRDFINITDIASILKDTLKKKWNGKIVDVGMGEATTINYIAGLFAYFMGKKIIYKPVRKEAKWSIANPTLLKTLYKKKLTTDLEKDIQSLCGPSTFL